MPTIIDSFSACTLLLALSFTVSASPASPRLLLLQETSLSNITIPASIGVPSGNKLHLAFYAHGHQHYSFNGTQWVLQKATAKLYTIPKNKLVGKHFYLPEMDAQGGQPSWKTFHLQSLVTAKTAAHVTIDEESIPWSLLKKTSESGSKKLLGNVTYVQRLKTDRGLALSNTSGAKTGDTHASKYSAIYAYYVKT